MPTSQSDGTWTGDWPTCADITSCPDPTTFDYPDEIETTWTSGDSTDFQTKITWKCKDRRYLIQRIGDDTTRGDTIENECLWYSNYTFLPSDLECILTYCDQVLEDIFIGIHQFVSFHFPLPQPTDEPNDSGSNYAFAWDNLRTPLDQDLFYPCKTNMKVENTTKWKSQVGQSCSSIKFITIFQASNGSVVRCGIDGEYIYPNPWPQCSEDINCGDPLPIQVNDPRLTATAPPGTRTWIVGTEGDDYYKAKVGYTIAWFDTSRGQRSLHLTFHHHF